jgi:hypothetical protein
VLELDAGLGDALGEGFERFEVAGRLNEARKEKPPRAG